MQQSSTPQPSAPEPRVVDNADKSRYEIYAGDDLAGFAQYRRGDSQLRLVHTEIDPRFQGAGLASTLARTVLDQAREQQLSVLPVCPYISGWIAKHRDYADLVPADRHADFGL